MIAEKIQNELREFYKGHIIRIVSELFGSNVLLINYGSLASGNFSRLSDIDIAIYTGQPIDGTDFFRLMCKIEETPIVREIDIVDAAKVSKYALLRNILEGDIWINSEGLLKSLRERLKDLEN